MGIMLSESSHSCISISCTSVYTIIVIYGYSHSVIQPIYKPRTVTTGKGDLYYNTVLVWKGGYSVDYIKHIILLRAGGV